MSDQSFPTGNDLTALTESLSAMASAVLGEESLTATLDWSLAVAAIPDTYGASVTLDRSRQLETISASSPAVVEMDSSQCESGRGPCVEATATGQIQHAKGDELVERWPEFGAATTEHGIAALLSMPLAVSDRTIGALNLYGAKHDVFSDTAMRTASAFAHHAAAVLANATTLAGAEQTNRNLMEALATRQIIGQAMGIIMAREHCSSDEAFDILRRASQRSNRKLRDIASEVVLSTDADATDE